ncbi:MAG: nickel-responsive transcriptional regulator NikR [Planctomycetaceae bacterium]|jgi:CopG family nickel-responsive transcriptional regulator|nr:nickel-responsive transcriptional regulator NikR [Planctomycetaceae bacterium]
MSTITRISISVEEELIKKFDSFSEEHGFPTRSEAIKSIIHDVLIKEEWTKGVYVAGSISLVYNHHKPGIVQKLLKTQHNFCSEIQCSQHVHLDHDNCMEIIVLRGTKERISEILKQLRQIKGLKHVVLTMTTTGKHLH